RRPAEQRTASGNASQGREATVLLPGDRGIHCAARGRAPLVPGLVRTLGAGVPGAAVSAERHAGPAVNPPVARSSHEAHLYMDLPACECGETRFPRASAVVTLPGGELASRYTGACAGCGRPREFVFRLAEDAAPGDGIRYGGDQPSELIDAGE